MLRQEDLRLRPAGTPAGQGFPATVETRVFLGARIRYVLRVGEHRLRCLAPPDDVYAPGDAVTIDVAAGKARLIGHIAEARLVVIPNTLELNTLWVSPALEKEVEAHPHLTRETDFAPIPLAADGTLDQERLFPESVRGRRAAGFAYAAQ